MPKVIVGDQESSVLGLEIIGVPSSVYLYPSHQWQLLLSQLLVAVNKQLGGNQSNKNPDNRYEYW